MKNEEFKVLKEKYEELKSKRNEVLDIQKEIAILIESEEVKKYLNLLDLLKGKTTGSNTGIVKLSDRDIINIALRETRITPDEDIYVYLGTYKYSDEVDIVHGSSDISVSRTNKDADYVTYQMLESYYSDIVEIPYKEADKFEETHKIIIPKNVASRGKYFYNLQAKYFETMLLKSPEEAKQKIKKLLNQ